MKNTVAGFARIQNTLNSGESSYDSWFISSYDSWFISSYDSWFISSYDSWFISSYGSWLISIYDSWFVFPADRLDSPLDKRCNQYNPYICHPRSIFAP